MLAVLFPGQGSQYVGMGSDFYEKFDDFKKNFDIVDKTLKYSLSEIILNGPEEKLKMTQNTQPAIMVLGVSIYNLLIKKNSFISNNSTFFAGHSLGEYTALVCSGSLTLEKAAYLLHERGKAMQEAVPKGQGGMLAILGSDIDSIDKILKDYEKNFECFIANDNSDNQLVVSGSSENIQKFSDFLNVKKIKNIKLSVSAPFHCKLMNNATRVMEKEIKKLEFKNFKNTLISNVTAKEIKDIDILKDLLVKQIESKVRWRESIKYMIDHGVGNFIEIGPGKVLSGLIKRINRDVKVSAINKEEDISIIDIND